MLRPTRWLCLCALVLAGCAMQAGDREAPANTLTIEVLSFQGCPNAAMTMANVDSAVKASGMTANVMAVDQTTLPPSDPRRHWGSPTVLVNGRDLFGMEPRHGSMHECRVYPNGGAPTEAEILAALRASGQ